MRNVDSGNFGLGNFSHDDVRDWNVRKRLHGDRSGYCPGRSFLQSWLKMSFEIIFASLVVSISIGMFEPMVGIIYYLAASNRTDWHDWWLLLLTTLAMFMLTRLVRNVTK